MKQLAVVLALVGFGFVLGHYLWPSGPTVPAAPSEAAGSSAPETKAPAVWTCSMHPQIRLPKPGICPLCGMDLIPAARR